MVYSSNTNGGSRMMMTPSSSSSTSTTTSTIGGIPTTVAEPVLVTYRSVGIGLYGVAMRFVGMPLEKIALYLNSSQVVVVTTKPGKGPFRQAVQLTFREGALAPYRVVGPASLVAWFFQYSVMGLAFQFFDQSLSKMLNVKPVYYGAELMEPPPPPRAAHGYDHDPEESLEYHLKYTFKTLLAPILSSGIETMISNRAEVQRYYGKEQFTLIEQGIQRSAGSKAAGLGMAFTPNFLRNQIMCQTTFLLTPITYKLYFPQEQKTPTTLFWYGLGMNMFVGNAVAITQQALWGRSLDSLLAKAELQQAQQAVLGSGLKIDYAQVIRQGLATEGMSAFFTFPKWSSRVLMNAPTQGALPWFYNEILPLGEASVLKSVKTILEYGDPFWDQLLLLETYRSGRGDDDDDDDDDASSGGRVVRLLSTSCSNKQEQHDALSIPPTEPR